MARSPHLIQRVLGPRLTLKEANLICWGLFFALLGPACYRGIQMQSQGGHGFLDADFVNFYAMGRLLNAYPAADLYDAGLQERVRNQIHPLSDGRYGPIPYPPFVGLLFQPFARLSYSTAYWVWLPVSLALYTAALVLVARRLFPDDPWRHSLLVCLAFCYFPFTFETLANGQLSTLGFCALSSAFLFDDSGRPLASGLALSLCAYKPTLLVLFLPMLLIRRQWKHLAGVFAGITALVVVTVLAVGAKVWPSYFGLLVHFGRDSVGIDSGSILNLSKYLDLAAFSALLPHGRSWPILGVILGFAAWAAFNLVRSWWRSARPDKLQNRMAWAAILTWTLLLNVYVPIYDSILVVLSALITAWVVQQAPQGPGRRAFALLWPAIFVGSWLTIAVAVNWRIQILTILLAALGVLQLNRARSISAASLQPCTARVAG